MRLSFLIVLLAGCPNNNNNGSSCPSPFTVCGATCTATSVDPANCGGWNLACPTGESCSGGVCACGFTTVTLGRLQSCGLRSDGKIVCAGSLNNSCNTAQFPDGSGNSCNQGAQFGPTF